MSNRCGECQNCLDLERVRKRVLACCNPPFSHAADSLSIGCDRPDKPQTGVVLVWNTELERLPCLNMDCGLAIPIKIGDRVKSESILQDGLMTGTVTSILNGSWVYVAWDHVRDGDVELARKEWALHLERCVEKEDRTLELCPYPEDKCKSCSAREKCLEEGEIDE